MTSSSSASPARPDDPRAPRLQDTIRLSADGLAKVLGDLEARVLQAVWRLEVPAPARAVHAEVVRDHHVAPLTVTTVLNKLVDKRILVRRKVDELLHYSARLSEEEFLAHVSRRVAEGILAFEPARVAASVIDVMAERDPAQLDELERLIQAARRQRDAATGTQTRTETRTP
ncbi:MAG: BlaI/MecI/CopY family transcriptional regulator [Gemmatimonadaceae bacterium]|jgi:predicted transcriptional regulator|nr:BlaI/MecI/CopY family transcriptional regulator [Gemmatimonadaceae bacterium]